MRDAPLVTDHIAAALHALGIRHAWGMPGGDSLQLVRALAAVGVDFHLVRDEASAGFAADATAQLTGAPGLCVATQGPGLTNLVSGVAGCLLDRAPVLAFTSRYPSGRRGIYTHMMLDQEKLFEATGKAWWRLTVDGTPGELRRAIAVAEAPRPGPVWLEVPVEVASAPCAATPLPIPPRPSPATPHDGLVERIASWERPVVLVGFAGRHADIEALAGRLRAPVLTTYKAKGALPEGTGWSAGAGGLSPVADAVHRALLDRADGLLLIGWDPAELRDHWLPGWREDLPVIALDEAVPTDLPTALEAVHAGPLRAAVRHLRAGASTWTLDDVAAHRASHDAVFTEDAFGPATAIRAVREGLVPDAVTALDVGAHRITAAHVWHCQRPDTLLQSNGFSSMGYGLPAALAAAATGHPAVAVVGDMGLQMTLGELLTAAENEWTIAVVVLVDDALSLIALKQERLGHPEHAVRFWNPDWEGLARAVGGRAVVARTAVQVTSCVREALEEGGVSLIAVPVDERFYRQQM